MKPTANGGIAPTLPEEYEKLATRLGTVAVESVEGQFV